MKEFSGIAVSSGTKKISKIRAEKKKPPYHPAQDYYKQFREAIIAAYAQAFGGTHITNAASDCTNPKKKANYKLIASKFNQWVGKKNPEWFTPPRGKYLYSNSEIILNPELGLAYSGEQHVIKLYFAEESVSQNRANYMLHLMQEKLPTKYEYHMLDIRRKKLFSATGDPALFAISIASEIASIEAAWKSL